jgi:hypothetical protein
MWDEMRQWLEQGGSIPNMTSLKSDLCAPLYSFEAGGAMKLERKEDMKKRGVRSPDEADALALTFAMPVSARPALPLRAVAYDPLIGAEASRAQRRDYDPLQR